MGRKPLGIWLFTTDCQRYSSYLICCAKKLIQYCFLPKLLGCNPPHFCAIYCIAGFCYEDFNVASHGIRNIKIRYICYLVTFYHVRFCNCLVLCLYFSISLKSKWGLLQTLKEHYLMHESI